MSHRRFFQELRKEQIELHILIMFLRYYLDAKGERVYTLKPIDPNGKPTICAHPARFSPADTYSRERITIKKRFNLLPTQRAASAY
ncbi:H/ACA ribonucleoprotein complex subunit 3 [Gryllus bimaculatus]|nr:H/ACA ribonucleoprotein complex subunit 3 [Gryllus bimaculatus]